MADGIKKLVKKADDAIDLEKHLPKRLLTEEAEAFAKKADKVADDVVEDAAKAIKSGRYSDTIKWGIHDIEVRPDGKGFWGRRIKQNNPRVDAYELKVNPNDESYYLPHPNGGYVQFENMVNCTVQDGKLIMKQKSFYHVDDMPDFVKNKVLQEAQRQIDSASLAGYKVEWLVSDESAVYQLKNLFKSNNMDIDIRYYPE